MGKLKHSVLILGEGPTEFYYFNSLRDVVKGLTIRPDYPKHTSMRELEEKIEGGIADGYDRIFCVIDMDTKDEEPERCQYARMKKKYAKPINKPKKGIYCEVRFFETHRCTELFFLYYFRYTARMYNDQLALLEDLNKETRILTPIHLADRLRPLCILASLQISKFHCLRFLPFCILTAF